MLHRTPMIFIIPALLTLFSSPLLSGCRTVLPRQSTHTDTIWTSYDDAKEAYNAVELDQTTKQDMVDSGIDLEAMPNVEVLNYVDVINRMSPLFDNKLPVGVQKCLDAELGCTGYVVKVRDLKHDRYGNVALDLFGFKKSTEISGWEMSATMLFVDDIVVYKSWSGTPQIKAYQKDVSPLGPVQSVGDFIGP